MAPHPDACAGGAYTSDGGVGVGVGVGVGGVGVGVGGGVGGANEGDGGRGSDAGDPGASAGDYDAGVRLLASAVGVDMRSGWPPAGADLIRAKQRGLSTDIASPKPAVSPTGLIPLPSPPAGLASRALTLLSSTVASALQASVHSFLDSSLSIGSLTLAHAPPDAAVFTFGQPPGVATAVGAPVATLTLLHPASFYARIAAAADIGFAEAYMAAEVVGGDTPGEDDPDALLAALRVLIANRDEGSLSPGRLVLSRLTSRVAGLVHLVGHRNSLAGSARNVAAHYDLSNALFATFLGPSWTYSCALWADASSSAAVAAVTASAAVVAPTPAGASPRAAMTAAAARDATGQTVGGGGGASPDALDEAQWRKLDVVIAKARLYPGCRVLEIGCGWGEFAIRAASATGARVTGITLSVEQLELATARAAAAGVSHLVRFELCDYRSVSGTFDRVVSIEMVEAVGAAYLPAYFAAVDRALVPDGLAVLQVITVPEARWATYSTTSDFITKHIFPGGCCPSLAVLVAAMTSASSLSVESVETFGPHYATTLAAWRARFSAAVRRGEVAAAGFDDTFVRKWLYYLVYCEAGFATRTLNVAQLVVGRAGNVGVLGGPPPRE
ncbi:hypothetical protein MMPV_000905 [Pyropia vietnamensis]